MRTTLTAALVVAGSVTTGGTALAGPVPTYAPPQVKTLPVVVANADGTATVRATYTCSGGPGGHLYIGVKQGPQINATDHTSSQYADTFYSTNYASDTPALSLTCDGKQHTDSFVVEADPGWAKAGSNPPPLSAGSAFVQFCIFDATSNFDEVNPTGFGADYSMRRVV
jgi:hypothetical protein